MLVREKEKITIKQLDRINGIGWIDRIGFHFLINYLLND